MEYQNEILDNNSLNGEFNTEEQTVISTSKFILLSIISFGTYQIWWMYKMWKFYQSRERLDIYPAARAFFSIFFLHSLMERNLRFAQENNYTKEYSSTAMYLGFLFSSFIGRLPDPFWLLSFISCFFLVPTFNAVQFAFIQAPEINAKEQNFFNTRQIILLVIGAALWALILFGMFYETTVE
jgi:hypothetical protein